MNCSKSLVNINPILHTHKRNGLQNAEFKPKTVYDIDYSFFEEFK